MLVFNLILWIAAETASSVDPNSFKCGSVKVGSHEYDLSALDHDWTTVGSYPLVFNPCSPIMFHGGGCPASPNTWMCAVDSASGKGKVALGAPQQLMVGGEGDLVMVYGGGDWAQGQRFPPMAMLRFKCNAQADAKRGPNLAELVGNVYQLEWETPLACPKQGQPTSPPPPAEHQATSFFAVLSLLTSGGLFAYFFTAILYRAIWQGKRGVEMIPHWGLISDIGSFIGELCTNIWHRLRGQSGGYQHI